MNIPAQSIRHRTGATEEADGDAALLGQIHVMVVGSIESRFRIHEALLREREIRLSVTSDAGELQTYSPEEAIQVVVLRETLSHDTLEACSRCIRQRWPKAKILVIHADESVLDDPLYDERLLPEVPIEDLVATIENLAGRRRS